MEEFKIDSEKGKEYPYQTGDNSGRPQNVYTINSTELAADVIGLKKDLLHQKELLDEKVNSLNGRIQTLEHNKATKDTQFFQIKILLIQFLVAILSFVFGNFFPVIKNHIK